MTVIEIDLPEGGTWEARRGSVVVRECDVGSVRAGGPSPALDLLELVEPLVCDDMPPSRYLGKDEIEYERGEWVADHTLQYLPVEAVEETVPEEVAIWSPVDGDGESHGDYLTVTEAARVVLWSDGHEYEIRLDRKHGCHVLWTTVRGGGGNVPMRETDICSFARSRALAECEILIDVANSCHGDRRGFGSGGWRIMTTESRQPEESPDAH